MRTLQRIAALCFIAVFSVFLFYIGREHQIFLDNKSIEIEGKNFRALQFVRISVNDASPIELTPRERDLAKVVGPSFSLMVEVMDEYGEEVERVIEKKLKPGFEKDIMISMPLLAADREDYLIPPPTVQASPPEPSAPAPEVGEEVI